MKKYLLAVCCAALFSNNADASFSSAARSFYLTDYQSGQVIAAKSEDDLMIPSSMIKLMTAELAFGALREGKISLNTRLPVSRNADYRHPALAGASRICLEQGQSISVEEALTGLIVVSGGDAAIILAEKLAGSEGAFAEMMTRRAREIGMEYSSFGNASGLPHADNLSTSKELAVLAAHIIREYPEYLHFFKTRRYEFADPANESCRAWAKSHAINYNKLLFLMGGAEGMKTGHTVKGGYGVVASANRKGRRLIAVINGFSAKNHDQLAAEAKRILEYGYENTFNKEIKSDVFIPVWYGEKANVLARPKNPFALTFDNDADLRNLRVAAIAPDNIAAPVAAGAEVGKIVATLNGREIKSEKLYAAESVQRVRWFGRALRNVKYFLTGN
jgi:D-alanyl-D-alanine carboxypeptidase (penicillin-binding protein 5/6)